MESVNQQPQQLFFTSLGNVCLHTNIPLQTSTKSQEPYPTDNKMKFTVPIIALFAAFAHVEAQNIDINGLLKSLGPIITSTTCAAPCLTQAVNQLKCNGRGPLAELCANVDNIKTKSQSCLLKCKIQQKDIGMLASYARDVYLLI